MGIKPPSPIMAAIYKKSFYQAGPVSTFIGRLPEGMYGIPLPRPFQHWIMLSAYNPGGILQPEGLNKKMFFRLEEELKRKNYIYYRGKGCLHNQWEPLVMVAAPIGCMKRMARKFRQNAIVILQKGVKSRLQFLA